MANPHQLPPGNTAFGRLSAASSPLPTCSSMPAVDYPQAFTAEQLASARSSLRLKPGEFPDFSQDTLSGLIPSDSVSHPHIPARKRAGYHFIGTFRCYPETHIRRLGKRRTEGGAPQPLFSNRKPPAPSDPAPPPGPDCHPISNKGPVTSCDCPCSPPPPSAHPHASASDPVCQPPTRKGKERARVRPPPSPNPVEGPQYLIPYYDTKLGRAFGDLECYTQLLPHSYEAGEFRRGAYDLACFTSCHLHPDNTSSPFYAQAASDSGSGGKTKKTSKPPSPQPVASEAAPPVKKGPPSLPGAQRRFFAS